MKKNDRRCHPESGGGAIVDYERRSVTKFGHGSWLTSAEYSTTYFEVLLQYLSSAIAVAANGSIMVKPSGP